MARFPRRGEVWLASFPDDPKSRPALVVSPDTRNEYGTSVLAVPITTNPRLSPTHLPLAAGEGGIEYDSVARCENVQVLLKSRLVRGPLGPAVDAATMRDVERALMISFGIAR